MSSARNRRLGGGTAAVATLLIAWLVLGLAGPAHATGAPAAGTAKLSAEKTTGLNPAADVVKLVGKGFQSNIQLYVLLCDPAKGAGRACDMGSFGAPVQVGADGAFTQDVKVQPKFGTTDCLKTRCAISTSKVGDGKDRTQEAYLPIGFQGEDAGLPASPAPATAAPQAGAPGGAPQTSAAAPSASPTTTSIQSTGQDKDEDEDDGNTGLIIGLIAAAAVVLVGVGVVVKRRRAGA
ncbi:neocarzinostatin apoprotein domain-containing protein [Embleya sp. NBC_00896]|uniref:neocarzinostatin apoprotein domain-containing protein n=1 Tax=Embleya sp. NBC_00896 TaxID=2975961 RepID=UPI0038648597|nr:neocarzinostatin apoprotein domain-containing protein [Embleya sp. NBC_00896]